MYTLYRSYPKQIQDKGPNTSSLLVKCIEKGYPRLASQMLLDDYPLYNEQLFAQILTKPGSFGHIAIKKKFFEKNFFKILFTKVDVNSKDHYGMTMLHWMLIHFNPQAKGTNELLDLLLISG